MTQERLETGLHEVGLQAALKHPKAKLWAKVNCIDNFTWAIKGAVENDIIGAVSDSLTRDEVIWINDMCANKSKKLEKFVLTICHEAYTLLKK